MRPQIARNCCCVNLLLLKQQVKTIEARHRGKTHRHGRDNQQHRKYARGTAVPHAAPGAAIVSPLDYLGLPGRGLEVKQPEQRRLILPNLAAAASPAPRHLLTVLYSTARSETVLNQANDE